MRTQLLAILLAILFVSCEVDPLEETSGKTLDVGSLSKMKAPHTCKDEDLAIIINEGRSVPTAPGSPKTSMIGIFFHAGNYSKPSLIYTKSDRSIGAISTGCQTSGCGPESRPLHNDFMNTAGPEFEGSYYLRPNPN